MHRSRLCALVIDSKGEDIDAAAAFWGRALGKPVVAPGPDTGSYREIETQDGEMLVLVQKVDHPARVHLDIETDDMEAEVRRLEALGARRVEFVKRWWVMEAPTGHRFCVVNPQRGPLDERANVWDEAGEAQT